MAAQSRVAIVPLTSLLLEMKMSEDTAKNLVTMTDGRQVEFGEKTKMKKEYGFDAATGLVWCRIDLVNGEVVEIQADPASDLGHQALGHGLSQKLGDAAAGADSVEDAFEAILEVAKRMANGEWTKTREGGGGTAKGSSELVQALCAVMGQDKETVRSMLAGLTAGDKAALRKVPEIATEIEKIKAAKAPSKSDAERVSKGAALLAALKGDTVPAE
jgi:hypothetical protein